MGGWSFRTSCTVCASTPSLCIFAVHVPSSPVSTLPVASPQCPLILLPCLRSCLLAAVVECAWARVGTLTLNKLTTEKGSVLCMGNRSLQEVLKLSALSANIVSEEPIDMVLHHSYDAHATLWDAHVSVCPQQPKGIRDDACDKGL